MTSSQSPTSAQAEARVWSGDELVAVLRAYDVPFLASEESLTPPPDILPDELLAALAMHSEARLRLALIPLLLVRPELADAAPRAARRLPAHAGLTLRCFYTAAYLLQQKYQAELASFLGEQIALRDWFSADLGLLPQGEPNERLERLGRCQAAQSERWLNWTGSYEHAAARLLTRLAREAGWQKRL